jgi:hypothetical protein
MIQWAASAQAIFGRCMRPHGRSWLRERRNRRSRWRRRRRFNDRSRLRRWRWWGSAPEPNCSRDDEKYQDEKRQPDQRLHPRQIVLRLLEFVTQHRPAPDGVIAFNRRPFRVFFSGLSLPVAFQDRIKLVLADRDENASWKFHRVPSITMNGKPAALSDQKRKCNDANISAVGSQKARRARYSRSLVDRPTVRDAHRAVRSHGITPSRLSATRYRPASDRLGIRLYARHRQRGRPRCHLILICVNSDAARVNLF